MIRAFYTSIIEVVIINIAVEDSKTFHSLCLKPNLHTQFPAGFLQGCY